MTPTESMLMAALAVVVVAIAWALIVGRRLMSVVDESSRRLDALQEAVDLGASEHARSRDDRVADQRTLSVELASLHAVCAQQRADLAAAVERGEANRSRTAAVEARAAALEGRIGELAPRLEHLAERFSHLDNQCQADSAALAAELGDLLQHHSDMMRAEIVAATAVRSSLPSRTTAENQAT